jgi:hypothetical protein
LIEWIKNHITDNHKKQANSTSSKFYKTTLQVLQVLPKQLYKMSATVAVATAAINVSLLIKEAMASMPDSLNTKKEIDEYYKKAMKDINDKVKEEKKADKAAAKAADKAEPKKPKAPKERVKKAAKPAEVDEDGNEIVKVKKPLNKYQMFIQQQRPKVKEDYPELSGEEIFTKIAELWKQHKESEAKSDSSDSDDTAVVVKEKKEKAPKEAKEPKAPKEPKKTKAVAAVAADVDTDADAAADSS